MFSFLHAFGEYLCFYSSIISEIFSCFLPPNLRPYGYVAVQRKEKAKLPFIELAIADQNFLFYATQSHPIPRFPIHISAVKCFPPCSQCKVGSHRITRFNGHDYFLIRISAPDFMEAGGKASRYICLTFRLEKLTFRVLICSNISLFYRIPVIIMVETISAVSCSF